MLAPETQGEAAPPTSKEEPKRRVPLSARAPSIIVGLIVAAVGGLSIWYLVRPQPLLVQGEVDATRFDIAARVDGRVAQVPVVRGQNVAAEAVLVRIDNPETLAEHGNAPQARLDQVTDALHESERATDQARSAYEQAVNGYTREEHEIAQANVQK